jgi:hypothetical protein
MAWLPEIFGANRENHIMRSSSVVFQVEYRKGSIRYRTFDAPANTVDVLRLAFKPAAVKADSAPLTERPDLNANGFRVQGLPIRSSHEAPGTRGRPVPRWRLPGCSGPRPRAIAGTAAAPVRATRNG